ncbi:Abi family protein [Pelistega europaea]|uniref:Abi-like protein n=1 Tax=Pelistega europaea TaxID=106147 RepID=A0A7Y4LDF3_9BURK|nr:Abi family protein [Pelistega europaea]NOL50407.1 hypothetical protein [Pelistega europaea]
MTKSSIDIFCIRRVLSAPRLSTYEKKTHQLASAINLYQWNMQIASALFECLGVCEIVVRNAVAQAIQSIHGEQWVFSPRFLRSIPQKRREDLVRARRSTVDKTIPELPFVFWQSFFTARFEKDIWYKQFRYVFPYAEMDDLASLRRDIFCSLGRIRMLRNRIAHHEPIFNENIEEYYKAIIKIIAYRCEDTAYWLEQHQRVSIVMAKKPTY